MECASWEDVHGQEQIDVDLPEMVQPEANAWDASHAAFAGPYRLVRHCYASKTMPKGSKALLILIVTALVGGCYSTSDYEGDGTLTEMKYRYELTLGEIDLSVNGISTYHLKGLPN